MQRNPGSRMRTVRVTRATLRPQKFEREIDTRGFWSQNEFCEFKVSADEREVVDLCEQALLSSATNPPFSLKNRNFVTLTGEVLSLHALQVLDGHLEYVGLLQLRVVRALKTEGRTPVRVRPALCETS